MAPSLIDLPLEIQRLIYEYYFIGSHDQIQLTWRSLREPVLVRVKDSATHFALLRTCRSVHRNARPYITSARLTLDARDHAQPYIVDLGDKYRYLLPLFYCCTDLKIPWPNALWTRQMPSLEHVQVFAPPTELTLSPGNGNTEIDYWMRPNRKRDRRLVDRVWDPVYRAKLETLLPKGVTCEIVVPVIRHIPLEEAEAHNEASILFDVRFASLERSAGKIYARRSEDWQSWWSMPWQKHFDKHLVAQDLVWYRTANTVPTVAARYGQYFLSQGGLPRHVNWSMEDDIVFKKPGRPRMGRKDEVRPLVDPERRGSYDASFDFAMTA